MLLLRMRKSVANTLGLIPNATALPSALQRVPCQKNLLERALNCGWLSALTTSALTSGTGAPTPPATATAAVEPIWIAMRTWRLDVALADST